MSSPAEPNRPETPNSEAEDQPVEEAPEAAAVETTECPNCGRSFVGDYCPSCGQEAGASLSPFDVITGFFRELVDVERGFWPTFKGLLYRPRTTLHEYLSGARKQFSHPGRYLMAAIVLAYLSERILVWIGIRAEYEPPDLGAEIGSNPSLTELLGTLLPERGLFEQLQILYSSQRFLIVASLLLALLVSLMFYQHLRDQLGGGEALAVGAFVSAQAIIFSAVVSWFFDSWMFFWANVSPKLPWLSGPAGELPIRLPYSLYLLFGLSYITASLFSTEKGENSSDGLLRVVETEPVYFFDFYLAWWLSFVMFQHFIMCAPIGLMLNYYVFSGGLFALIAMLLVPNLLIEIYYRAF